MKQTLAPRYEAYLAPLGEPLALMKPESDLLTFRLVWLRTFHVPMVVALRVGGDSTGTLRVKQGNLKGYYPDSLVLDKSLQMDKDTIVHWLAMLDTLDYWRYQPPADGMVTDGAHWILEAIGPTGRKSVDVHSPGDSPYRRVCLELLRLSRTELGPIY